MRVTRWFWPAVTAGMVGNALRMRQRVAALKVMEPSEEPPDPTHLLVTADGVEVDYATACAASQHALRHGLEALDLVPADLPVERLIDLAWLTHPGRFRDDPLARGRGALSALLLTEDLASRLGVTTLSGLSQVEMLRLCARAKRYAPLASDLAVAPRLRAAAHHDPAARMPCLEASFSVAAPMVVGAHAVCLAALAKGAASRRPAALAALAAHALVPLVATRGTAMTPRDMPVRVPGRFLAASEGLVRSAFARRRQDPAAVLAAAVRRADYAEQLRAAGGLDAFFGERRPDCPLCGSDRVDLLLEVPDLNQGKPGTFRLDECAGCGHVFQNPRLTPAGLDFYYGDFYDGMGAEHTELVFGAGRPSYRGRAVLVQSAAVGPGDEPRRWLDVGAGQGHFCLVARSVWPKATFDGLDIGAGIDEAERRGWIDQAWRGLFPDLAGSAEIEGRYDVVSMHHYLEHTDDPAVELDAARTALEPGGLLLIELPDASSWLGRRLGRYWAPWLQPQHLHFLTAERLQTMLAERGFTVLACQRSEPHQPAELLLALYLAVNQLAPPVDMPWSPPSTRRARWRRALALGLTAPLFIVAVTLDGLLGPILSRTGASNSFRVLARAPTPAPAPQSQSRERKTP
jgi:SAM-dependent methyltransferase